MAFRWVCNTCGQLHGSNPSRCRACGATVLTPVSRSKVAEYSTTPSEVEALDPDEIMTYGTTPEPEYESSPDVAPDGSIQTAERDAGSPSPAPPEHRGVFGIPIEILTVCVVLGLMAAIVFLL